MNLKEEKATDKKLNGLAKRKINRKAAARQRKRFGKIERAHVGGGINRPGFR
jgi:hypothetical protein